MWIRKSDEAIKNLLEQKAQERKSPRSPLIWAFVFTVVGMILFSFGIRGARGVYYLTSPTGFFEFKNLFLGGFVFALLFSLIYLHQKCGFSILSSDESFLCNECQDAYLFNPENACRCGGRLEPSDFFSWEG